MAVLRAEYEARLAERESETARMRQELDRLRHTVRDLGQEAHRTPDQEAPTALEALAQGDMVPAVEFLRQKMEERLSLAGEARRGAADAARQLGTILKLVISAGALSAFRQAAECDPKDFWTWIEIARLEQVAGTLDAARKAMDAALQTDVGDERLRSVALADLGDVLVAQGNLPEALKSFRDGLAIAERLAQSDPGNAGWQRDLSVATNEIGDVLVAQGNLPEALKSFRDGLAIRERLAQSDPGNAGWQRDLSCQLQQDRRCAGGAGQSAGGAEIVSRRARHCRAAGAGRPRQRRLAARSVGQLQQDRRCAGGAGQSAGGAEIVSRRARHRRAAGAVATPATPAGSAICRCRYNKIGDVLVAQGNLPEALKSFRDGLAIRERLAQADPGNAGWQRDLSVMLRQTCRRSTKDGRLCRRA